MKRDIILAGVGGQGILTIATIIGHTAVERGLQLKQAEVHGMSQRGGDVQSHLRYADHEIYSDLIPHAHADLIISVEPMESLRYLPYLAPDGWIIANKTPYVNIMNYPPVETVWSTIENFPNSILVDGEGLAREVANSRAMNIVILGAASHHLALEPEDLEHAISVIFARKGDPIVQANLKAFRAGRAFAEAHQHA